MNYQTAYDIARQAGFSHMGPLDPKTIVLKPEVRQMCASCRMYNTRWSCPPGCGPLDECTETIARHQWGILVQSVGELEDTLDYEAMKETETLHKERFLKMYKLLREQGCTVLALGAGCCVNCKECTYPDSPCRFPEEIGRAHV